MGEDTNGKKGNMWSSIFSLVTKVRKHVLVCFTPLQRKTGTKCRGIFDIADHIYSQINPRTNPQSKLNEDNMTKQWEVPS